MTAIEVYHEIPKGFDTHLEASATFIEIDGKLLFLQYARKHVGCWGVPGGKIEENELPIDAAKRELFEETGIDLKLESKIHPIGKLYYRKPDIDYVFHMFHIHLPDNPAITLSDEHLDFIWQPIDLLEDLHLMPGAPEAIHYYRNQRSQWIK